MSISGGVNNDCAVYAVMKVGAQRSVFLVKL